MTGGPHQEPRDLARVLAAAEASLAEQQPVVQAWGASARRRGRRRRHVVLGVAATVTLVLAAIGTGLATALSPDDPVADALTASPSGEASSASLGPSVVAAPDVSASATTSAVATPTSSPAATGGGTPSSSQRETARPSKSYPPYGTQDIVVTAKTSDSSPQVGEEVIVDVLATGRAETPPFLQGPRVDDSGPGWVVSSCVAPGPDAESPPPARDQTVSKTVTYTFDTPGRHTLTFRADSACSYYRGSDELTVVFEVRSEA